MTSKTSLKTRKIFLNRFNDFYREFLKHHSNELVILENDLSKMKLDDSIIMEDIFKLDEFVKLLDFIRSSEEDNMILNPREMADYFPVKSKIRRKLLKPYFDKPLYVSLIDENSIDNIENAVSFWTNLNEDNEEFRRFVADVYNSFSDATALFYMSDSEKGIMFLKKDEFSIEDLRHEFIHYYRWALKDDTNEEIDVDDLYKKYRIQLAEMEESFDCTEDDFEYFCIFDEFETLLNDAVDSLLEIRDSMFSDLSHSEYADLVFRTFFYDKKKMNSIGYLDKLLQSSFLNEIKNRISLKFIVFNVVIGYNVNRMKTHIFSELTGRRRYIFK